jgi:hypothetical protein
MLLRRCAGRKRFFGGDYGTTIGKTAEARRGDRRKRLSYLHLRMYAGPHAFSILRFVCRRFGTMMKVVKVGWETEMQMEKTLKIVAGVAVTLVALGIIANLKDIKRYWRISTM